MLKRPYFQGGGTWNKLAHLPPCIPHILNAFVANALNHFLLADAEMTVNALGRYMNAVLRGSYPAPTDKDAIPFYDISKPAVRYADALQQSFIDANPELYSKMTSNADPQAYFDGLWKTFPETRHLGNINGFFSDYYDLNQNLRIVSALVMLGLLFAVLHDTAFASLCKNKDFDASTMTLEHKTNEPLDPEALYSYLQAKLNGVCLPKEPDASLWVSEQMETNEAFDPDASARRFIEAQMKEHPEKKEHYSYMLRLMDARRAKKE